MRMRIWYLLPSSFVNAYLSISSHSRHSTHRRQKLTSNSREPRFTIYCRKISRFLPCAERYLVPLHANSQSSRVMLRCCRETPVQFPAHIQWKFASWISLNYLFIFSFIYYILYCIYKVFFFLSSFYISVPFECASHLPPMMQIRKKQNKKSAAASDIHSIYMFHYEYWLRLTHHSSQLCAPMPWLSPSIADDQIRCEHIKNIYLYSSYFVAGHEHRQKHEHIISVWQ